MPLLVLLHSKSNLVELKNCPTSHTDPKHRRGNRESSDTWGLNEENTFKVSAKNVSCSWESLIFPKLITGWPRFQTRAAKASWLEGPLGWSECRGSSPS